MSVLQVVGQQLNSCRAETLNSLVGQKSQEVSFSQFRGTDQDKRALHLGATLSDDDLGPENKTELRYGGGGLGLYECRSANQTIGRLGWGPGAIRGELEAKNLSSATSTKPLSPRSWALKTQRRGPNAECRVLHS